MTSCMPPNSGCLDDLCDDRAERSLQVVRVLLTDGRRARRRQLGILKARLVVGRTSRYDLHSDGVS